MTRTMRRCVIAQGGSLLTERPLAMRERSLSGSGWKVYQWTPKVRYAIITAEGCRAYKNILNQFEMVPWSVGVIRLKGSIPQCVFICFYATVAEWSNATDCKSVKPCVQITPVAPSCG